MWSYLCGASIESDAHGRFTPDAIVASAVPTLYVKNIIIFLQKQQHFPHK